MDMRDIPGLLPRLEALKTAIEQGGGKPISIDGDLATADESDTAALSPEHAELLDQLGGMGAGFLSRLESAIESIEKIPDTIDEAMNEIAAVKADVESIKGQLADATASFNRISEQLEASKVIVDNGGANGNAPKTDRGPPTQG